MHAPLQGSSVAERQWHIVGRWQEYEGEGRANLLRIIGVGAFYCVELMEFYGLRLGSWEIVSAGSVTRETHLAITAVAVAWAMLALGIRLALTQRVFPRELKYVSTALDIVLLTSALTVLDGAKNPLVIVYLILVAMAGLRFSVGLIWFATAGSAAGYLFLLGYAKWFAADGARPPRYAQVIFLLALLLMGIVVGQITRRVRKLAEDYAARLGVRAESPS